MHVTKRSVFAETLVVWLSNLGDLEMDFATHIQLLTGVSPAGSSNEVQVLRAWARFGFI